MPKHSRTRKCAARCVVGMVESNGRQASQPQMNPLYSKQDFGLSSEASQASLPSSLRTPSSLGFPMSPQFSVTPCTSLLAPPLYVISMMEITGLRFEHLFSQNPLNYLFSNSSPKVNLFLSFTCSWIVNTSTVMAPDRTHERPSQALSRSWWQLYPLSCPGQKPWTHRVLAPLPVTSHLLWGSTHGSTVGTWFLNPAIPHASLLFIPVLPAFLLLRWPLPARLLLGQRVKAVLSRCVSEYHTHT